MSQTLTQLTLKRKKCIWSTKDNGRIKKKYIYIYSGIWLIEYTLLAMIPNDS